MMMMMTMMMMVIISILGDDVDKRFYRFAMEE